MEKRIITEIWIYPVKSMGGIPLDKATVMAKGLEYDRRWMLVDEQNTSMTQRVYPLMALFKLAFAKEGINISFEEETKLLPFTSTGETFPALVWNDTVDVIEVQHEISEWIAGILGVKCKLVYFPESNARPVEQPYAKN